MFVTTMRAGVRGTLAAAVLAAALAASAPVVAENPAPYPGTQVVATGHAFETLWDRLKKAIKANKMGIVAQACASCGAKNRGVTIPGNAVVMAYRNDFAVRMLAASVAAGIEAPLRFYVTENADGKATLTYRMPSAVFAPYGNADLDAMARELDAIWERIVRDTVGG
ncbi:MAG: DUF302 domain-containing protein [Alphaproteobacteria bacterium]